MKKKHKYNSKYKTYYGLDKEFTEYHCFDLAEKADVKPIKKGYCIIPHDGEISVMFYFTNTNTIYFKGNNTLYRKGLDLIYKNLNIDRKLPKNDLL